MLSIYVIVTAICNSVCILILSFINFFLVEVEGYGPYKPVPPPKPLPQQPTPPQPQPRGCFTPPPYKMPPYPIYNEPSIPGATGLESATSTCSLTSPQSLRTHSSKFPVGNTF